MLPQPKKDDTRKRKTHTKSRKGCGNCKLRRVKCDETKPQCTKCLSYGVTCNYDSTNPENEELQLPGEGAFSFTSKPNASGPASGPDKPPKDSLSPEGDDINTRIDSMLGVEMELLDSKTTGKGYILTQEDVEILRMFKDQTVYTIGTAQTVLVYRSELVDMIINSKAWYLIHVVMTLTLMNARYKNASNPWTTFPSEKETFHWYHGTGIFNRKLSEPLKDSDRDPLWGAAALLGAVTIASTDATCAEEAWPLKPPSPEDLDWLRMSDGKKEVWKLVDPLREDSVWAHALDYEHHKDPTPYDHPVPELNLLYPYLTKIYEFNPFEAEKPEDPYHTAASILVRLLELDCNHSTIMYFLSFLGHMDLRYRDLLHAKDPRALLLLAWWYGKLCQYNVWWISRRMTLEGQAICLYLEKYHSDQKDIMRLLDYPKVMTGLVGR